jgi:hypothetical protein
MGWAQVASMDAPSSNVFALTSLDFSTYTIIQIVCSGITVTSDDTDMQLRFYVSGAEVTGGTDYHWGVCSISAAAAINNDGVGGASSIQLQSDDAGWSVGNAATEGFHSVITVGSPASTSLYKYANYHTVLTTLAGQAVGFFGAGVMLNAGAIDGVKVFGSTNLTAGKVRILGLA